MFRSVRTGTRRGLEGRSVGRGSTNTRSRKVDGSSKSGIPETCTTRESDLSWRVRKVCLSKNSGSESESGLRRKSLWEGMVSYLLRSGWVCKT